MPAMRRKERSGPGMEVVAVDVEGVEPESPRADNHGKAHSNITRQKTRRQEDFIAHILCPSRKGYLTRAWRTASTSDGIDLEPLGHYPPRLGTRWAEDRSSIPSPSIVAILYPAEDLPSSQG